MEGKPGAGITVEAHKGGDMMTSFDGKYEVAADPKTKWLKFTYIDETKKLDLDENSGDEIDFYFDDIKPAEESQGSGVSNKTLKELMKDQDLDFLNEYSLYDESYKQGEYETAFPHWYNIYNRYPRVNKNIYIRGVEMYERFFEKAPTWEEKEDFIRKSMEVYDKRINHFGERGYVLGRKGNAWFNFYRQKDDLDMEKRKEVMKKGYEWLYESAHTQGVESETAVLVLLMQSTTSLFGFGELPKETVVQNYEFCVDLLNQMISGDDEEKVQKAEEILPYIEDIFGKSGAADCDALISIFTPQYEQNLNDAEFIKGMLTKLRKAKCDDFDLVNIATERLYELEPSAEAAFNMARYYLKREDYPNAKKYYQEAMAQETDEELLATYYYEYARFIFII
jgi:tetratricopeptide (TPR) repeat protein